MCLLVYHYDVGNYSFYAHFSKCVCVCAHMCVCVCVRVLVCAAHMCGYVCIATFSMSFSLEVFLKLYAQPVLINLGQYCQKCPRYWYWMAYECV